VCKTVIDCYLILANPSSHSGSAYAVSSVSMCNVGVLELIALRISSCFSVKITTEDR